MSIKRKVVKGEKKYNINLLALMETLDALLRAPDEIIPPPHHLNCIIGLPKLFIEIIKLMYYGHEKLKNLRSSTLMLPLEALAIMPQNKE
jgi:hypothetical protein